ncbi:MAG: hypothetical protein ACRDV3_03150 [Acidothermaceae bacterium]
MSVSSAPASVPVTPNAPTSLSASPSSPPRPTNSPALTGDLTAVVERWTLARPLSREAVVVDGGELLIAGGLTSQGTTGQVVQIDPASGTQDVVGALARPAHDAAAATLANVHFVFGGGASATSAAAQTFGIGAASKVVGQLPVPRSDLDSAVVGSVAYVLGGYDGSAVEPQVLATSDGRHFDDVGSLPVPVRYPAVAALGNDIYVFGGEHNGTPTDAVQRFDTRTRSSEVVGHLRAPLAHATGIVISGTIYLLGGVAGVAGGADTAPVAAISRFDPSSEATVAAGRLPYAVSDAGAAVIGDTAYLLGGEGPQRLATVIAIHP